MTQTTNSNEASNNSEAIKVTYFTSQIVGAPASTTILRGRTKEGNYSGELHIENLPAFKLTRAALDAFSDSQLAELATMLEKQRDGLIRKLFAMRAGTGRIVTLTAADISAAAILADAGSTERNSLTRAGIEALLATGEPLAEALQEYAAASNWQAGVAEAVAGQLAKFAAVNPPVAVDLAKKLAAHLASIIELAELQGAAATTAAQLLAKVQQVATAKTAAAANLLEAL